jgi:hypothetical protein
VETQSSEMPIGAYSRDADRAAELVALQRDFPRYGFETHVLAGQEHYTARRRPGEHDVRPYSVTTADLAKLRRELTPSTDPAST